MEHTAVIRDFAAASAYGYAVNQALGGYPQASRLLAQQCAAAFKAGYAVALRDGPREQECPMEHQATTTALHCWGQGVDAGRAEHAHRYPSGKGPWKPALEALPA